MHSSVINHLVRHGLAVRGREHLDGLLGRATRNLPNVSVHDAIVQVFLRGRSFGVYLFCDPASFDIDIFSAACLDAGFSQEQARMIIGNLHAVPPPETMLLNVGE